jgi:hypothetical protein
MSEKDQQIKHLEEELLYLRRQIQGLKNSHCWCSIGVIGLPSASISSHSIFCAKLQAYFKRIETYERTKMQS